MNNRKIIKDFRNSFVNLHALVVLIVTFLELIGLAVILKEEIIRFSWDNSYLWQSVIIPISLNVLVHIAARILVFKSSLNDNLKNAVIVYAALITSAVVSICHRDFIITSCAFIFPVVLSTAFNDKKILGQSIAVTVATYFTTAVILYFENKMTVGMNLNMTILFGFMIVSYLCAGVSIKYTDKNYQTINSQASDNERLKDRVHHDGMTGLYNHRSFYSILKKAVNAYHSDGIRVCLAMLDIDNFKSINDTYGHDDGDAVLVALSDIMKNNCIGDKVCRYGGEEFGIIFLDKDFDQAHKTVSKILDEFSECEFDFSQESITFSCGICEYDGKLSAEEFFAEADRKLYRAKHEGKNKIVV